MRAAAKTLGLGVVLGGPVLEADGFWSGVETTMWDASAGGAWPADILAVVLPAWVENQPRRLLKAVAAGLPVVASENCGLGEVRGVMEVPAGDVDALQACLAGMMAREGISA